MHFATFFAAFFGAVVGALGIGGSGWVIGGVNDTPSSEPLGEVVGEPPEDVVDEPPGEVLGGLGSVVNVCVRPKASCHLFAARRR